MVMVIVVDTTRTLGREVSPLATLGTLWRTHWRSRAEHQSSLLSVVDAQLSACSTGAASVGGAVKALAINALGKLLAL